MRLDSPQYEEWMEWSLRAALALGPTVGKRPRKTAAGCMHQICLLNALTGTHTGGWRIIPREKLDGAAPHARSTPRESPPCVSADASTPASRALVLPSGYKAFSKQRRLLSDQDCPRQHHTAGKHGCGDSYWWVVTKLSPSFHQFVSMLSPSALLNLSAFVRRRKKTEQLKVIQWVKSKQTSKLCVGKTKVNLRPWLFYSKGRGG